MISGLRTSILRSLKQSRVYLIGKIIQMNLNKNGMHILIKNLLNVMKGIGSRAKGFPLILLALTICTCSGPRLMLGDQTFEKPIDYSLFIGKRVKQIDGVMECAISRIDVQVFRLWHPQRQLTWLPYLPMHGTEYCPNLEPMRRKCSQIKWYQYRSIIHSFSDPSRTVWIAPRQNLRTEYPLRNLHVKDSNQKIEPRKSLDWTPLSTGKIPGTIHMMERNSHFSSMMKPANGNARKTFSITGESQKQRSDLVRE